MQAKKRGEDIKIAEKENKSENIPEFNYGLNVFGKINANRHSSQCISVNTVKYSVLT
jgi:hypothetical protein